MAAAISAIEDAGLQLPLLAKPRLAGRAGSHQLALIRDLAGLQSLVKTWLDVSFSTFLNWLASLHVCVQPIAQAAAMLKEG